MQCGTNSVIRTLPIQHYTLQSKYHIPKNRTAKFFFVLHFIGGEVRVKLFLHRPRGLQEFEASRFLKRRHTKVVRLSVLGTGRLYPPGKISILFESESTRGHSAAGRITLTKNLKNSIGNRARDLAACSAVP